MKKNNFKHSLDNKKITTTPIKSKNNIRKNTTYNSNIQSTYRNLRSIVNTLLDNPTKSQQKLYNTPPAIITNSKKGFSNTKVLSDIRNKKNKLLFKFDKEVGLELHEFLKLLILTGNKINKPGSALLDLKASELSGMWSSINKNRISTIRGSKNKLKKLHKSQITLLTDLPNLAVPIKPVRRYSPFFKKQVKSVYLGILNKMSSIYYNYSLIRKSIWWCVEEKERHGMFRRLLVPAAANLFKKSKLFDLFNNDTSGDKDAIFHFNPLYVVKRIIDDRWAENKYTKDTKLKALEFFKKWILKKDFPVRRKFRNVVNSKKMAIRAIRKAELAYENYKPDEFNALKKLTNEIKSVKSNYYPFKEIHYNYYKAAKTSIFDRLSGSNINLVHVIGRLQLVMIKMFVKAKENCKWALRQGRFDRGQQAIFWKTIAAQALRRVTLACENFNQAFYNNRMLDHASHTAISGRSLFFYRKFDNDFINPKTATKLFLGMGTGDGENRSSSIETMRQAKVDEAIFLKKFSIQASMFLGEKKYKYLQFLKENRLFLTTTGDTGRSLNKQVNEVFKEFIRSNEYLFFEPLVKDDLTDEFKLIYAKPSASWGINTHSGSLSQTGGYFKDKYIAYTSIHGKDIFMRTIMNISDSLKQLGFGIDFLLKYFRMCFVNKPNREDSIFSRPFTVQNNKSDYFSNLRKVNESIFTSEMRLIFQSNPLFKKWYERLQNSFKHTLKTKQNKIINYTEFTANIDKNYIFKNIYKAFSHYKIEYASAINSLRRSCEWGSTSVKYGSNLSNNTTEANGFFKKVYVEWRKKTNVLGFYRNRYSRKFISQRLGLTYNVIDGNMYPSKILPSSTKFDDPFYNNYAKKFLRPYLGRALKGYFKNKITLRHAFLTWWGTHKFEHVRQLQRKFIKHKYRWNYFFNIFENRVSKMIFNINWLGTGTLENYKWLIRSGLMTYQGKWSASARCDSQIKRGQMFSLPNDVFSFFKSMAVKKFFAYNRIEMCKTSHVNDIKKDIITKALFSTNVNSTNYSQSYVEFLNSFVESNSRLSPEASNNLFVSKKPNIDNLFSYNFPIGESADERHLKKLIRNQHSDLTLDFIKTYNTLKNSDSFEKLIVNNAMPQPILYPLTITDLFIKDRNVLYILRRPKNFDEMHHYSRHYSKIWGDMNETYEAFYKYLFNRPEGR